MSTVSDLYTAAVAATGDEHCEGEYLHHASPYLVVEIIDRLRALEGEIAFVAGLANPERMSGSHLTDKNRAQLAFAMIDNVTRRAADLAKEVSE